MNRERNNGQAVGEQTWKKIQAIHDENERARKMKIVALCLALVGLILLGVSLALE
jgi:hypothetical protein